MCLLVFNALEHLCKYTVLGWIYRSRCLPCIPVSRKHWDTYSGSSPPPPCSHIRFESASNKRPCKRNVQLLKLGRSPSQHEGQILVVVVASFEFDHVFWINNRQCHRKKKVKKSWEAIWSFTDPRQPPCPPTWSPSHSWAEEGCCTEVLQDVPQMKQVHKQTHENKS